MYPKNGMKINLPNAISMLRLLLIPCFFLVMYYYLAGVEIMLIPTRAILILIVISDFLDGFLARRLGEVTTFGSLLDPLADKLFVTASYLLLTAFGQIPAWLTITVVAKDVIISLGWCILAVLYNKLEANPTFLGKTATALQFITIFIIVMFPSFFAIRGLEYMTAGFTVLALIHYIYLGLQHSPAYIRSE